MKKIVAYRQLLNVDRSVTLKELKTIYRNAMKEYHPDKFHDDTEGLAVAEAKSKDIIEAYHHLVSINPETIEQGREAYTTTITSATIVDYYYENVRLHVAFSDGSAYEYISVPKATYVKMVNADSPGRFAKRHIFGAFPYRKVSNEE
ncbi:KTSC domain-containing protein [Flavobacterium caeni]|uniref:DnaJ domain-containing protein n=1 Tax=Flavobacterium caeni TaxID=490189 RepID=A0A1G5JXB4_9FLAO|nr:KTSC domain-containing protein [Flavobacterium caeni]SCY93005.1 DnaJ domain-containing protein [Flavobacterium caeni]